MAKEDTYRSVAAEAMADVLAFRGSSAFSGVVRLLDALEDCYREEMLTVKPENLLHKQGAAAQVRLLRNALVFARPDSITDLPKV